MSEINGGISPLNVSAGVSSNNVTKLVFSNSNGVSFGLNGSTLTASAGGGATLNAFEPWNPATPAEYQGGSYFQPFATVTNPTFPIQPIVVPNYVAVSRLNILANFPNPVLAGSSFALNTTGESSSTSFGYTASVGAAIYSRQLGASSSLLTQVTSNLFTFGINESYAASISSSNSLSVSMTVDYIIPSSISSNGSYAYTTLNTSGSTSTSATNASPTNANLRLLTGNKVIAIPLSITLAPQEYWVVNSLGVSTNVSSMGWLNNGNVKPLMGFSANTDKYASLAVLGSVGAGTASNASVMPQQGWGVITNNGSTTAFPAQITLSNVSQTNTAGAGFRQYINFSNYPLA